MTSIDIHSGSLFLRTVSIKLLDVLKEIKYLILAQNKPFKFYTDWETEQSGRTGDGGPVVIWIWIFQFVNLDALSLQLLKFRLKISFRPKQVLNFLFLRLPEYLPVGGFQREGI